MVIVLNQAEEREVALGSGADGQLWIPTAETERVSGWSWNGKSLCKGDVAVPIPNGKDDDFVREEAVNLAAFWRHMEKPILSSESADVWVLGAGAAERTADLHSLQAPDFTLPDLDGKLHSLSDFRGKKVFLASWASW